MKALWLALAVAVGSLVPARAQTPVVVELFTSEGCSSCPPADALLMQLDEMKAANGSEIIILGEHVDYWNHIGWTDRFSSAAFSKRQRDYVFRFDLQSSYTPQMVVDGSVQFVGNNGDKLKQAILEESQKAKPVNLSLALQGSNAVRIKFHLPEGRKRHLMLAVTEDGLSSSVAAGENSGRTLRHAGVVRNLTDLGEVKPGEVDRSIPLPNARDWNPANLKVVVWVQEGTSGPILGAASLPLVGSPAHVSSATSTP
jgi:hypothetical protein